MSVRVFIGRQELSRFTSLRLTRSKKDLTGSLSLDVFMNYTEGAPVLGNVQTGQEILVYVGNHLAFTGSLDRRVDSGDYSGESEDKDTPVDSDITPNIGPNNYTISLQSRGKTKVLIDSSHVHPTGTILQPTNKSVFEELLAPFDIAIEWLADEIELNRVRLRDGALVVDELQRMAERCSLYVHETRAGALRVTDEALTVTGQPLVLGQNILRFRTEQLADKEKGEVTVKSQRTDNDSFGEDAVLPTQRRTADGSQTTVAPIVVQMYGNGNEQLLAKRTDYEQNKRMAEGKQIVVDVFHVQQPDGLPWDIGGLHYVEIPPAGVVGQFEITNVTYNVQSDRTLSTTLTLAPKPVKNAAADSTVLLSDLPGLNDDVSAVGRAAALGVSGLTDVWNSPELSEISTTLDEVVADVTEFFSDLTETTTVTDPPLELPAGFRGDTI